MKVLLTLPRALIAQLDELASVCEADRSEILEAILENTLYDADFLDDVFGPEEGEEEEKEESE